MTGDLNRLAAYLADPHEPESADLIVLVGSAVLSSIPHAIDLFERGFAPQILVCGGIGHSTPLLWEKAPAHRGLPEAMVFSNLLRADGRVPPPRVYIEDQSRNCGENAAFSYRLLQAVGRLPGSILLIQDPAMQRRTAATFRREWQRHGMELRVVNAPSCVPQFTPEGQPEPAEWSAERLRSLLLGEIPRLRNHADGYGPQGRDFIEAVEIPEEIEAAWARAVEQDPVAVRRLP
jgi:uncharacterized SAM-binding protein YcdF (DUF218 family)